MYDKIIVPLDGSKLAEIALPYAEEVAKGCNASEIVLVTVTESMRAQIPTSEVVEQYSSAQLQSQAVFIDRWYGGRATAMGTMEPILKMPVTLGRMAKSGRDYLVKIAKQLEKKGLKPTTAVLIGNPAAEIVHFATEEKADLIVMASHGRSGVSHWAIGSVAEKVFRASDIPIMLVKPKSGTAFKETKSRRKGKPT